MNQEKLKKALHELGWWFKREGGNHEIWTNGVHTLPVPRHTEIEENTAKAMLKKASKLK